MKRLQQTGKGLGSDIVFTLVTQNETASKVIFKELWLKTQVFEKRFSRFLEDSELTQVNKRAGEFVDVSPEFLRLAKLVKQLSEACHGVYNPLVLPALQQAGYKGSWPSPGVFKQSLNYSARTSVTGTHDLVIKSNQVKLPKNRALDFGGIGKGYLLDELGQYLESSNFSNYWLSLGGDILVSGFNLENQPWQIGVAKADSADEIIKQIKNEAGKRLAIATSGITKRRGSNWHHLINPQTGRPADTDILTATLAHSSATMADVFAKCLVIVGSKSVKDFLKDLDFKMGLVQAYTGNRLKIIEV